MKSVTAMLLIFAILLNTAPLLASGDAGAGKEVFTKKCASCHGAAGEGKDTIAKMLKVELRHLGSKEVQAKTDVDLKKEVTEGIGKMKPVKDLNDKATDDVVAYLRTLLKK
jgi:mono/diheme cytochrome c family protein